jgi:hypothetical protein
LVGENHILTAEKYYKLSQIQTRFSDIIDSLKKAKKIIEKVGEKNKILLGKIKLGLGSILLRHQRYEEIEK